MTFIQYHEKLNQGNSNGAHFYFINLITFFLFLGRGKEVAVIYGGLPPGTKLAQAAKFNDPNNSCKVMVATDAIGMGLNLLVNIFLRFTQ